MPLSRPDRRTHLPHDLVSHSSGLLPASVFQARVYISKLILVIVSAARLVRLEVVERTIAAVWGRSGVSVARVVAVVNLTVEAATAVKPPTTSGSVPRHFSTEKGVPNSHPAG